MEERREEMKVDTDNRLPLVHSPLIPMKTLENLRLQISKQVSSLDYPVFTPSYEKEPLPGSPGCHQIQFSSRNTIRNWDSIKPREREENCGDPAPSIHSKKKITDDMKIRREINTIDSSKRSDNVEMSNVTMSNGCKPAIITKVISNVQAESHKKNKLFKFPWLFKKKSKTNSSSITVEFENSSLGFNGYGKMSMELLKEEIFEAHSNKEEALMEAATLRFSLIELKEKVAHLEAYCEELKQSLKDQIRRANDSRTKTYNKSNVTSKRKHFSLPWPVSHEVMIEGFLQMVSETRVSVKNLSKNLITQIKNTDNNFIKNLSLMPEDYKYPKRVLYTLQAHINKILYKNFENRVFEKNGSPAILDPYKERLENFSTFVELRNSSWNEIYRNEFSRFCEKKKDSVESLLDCSRLWNEDASQSFFASVKSIWLLHLLAFSFDPPLIILRVGENRRFDRLYMEDVLSETHSFLDNKIVEIMVMPGFYVGDKVLKCKVLCR